VAASFTADPTSGSAPLEVAFTDTSTGSPSAWDWDFGDGSAHSDDQNPTHTFAAGGSFLVTLTATISGDPSVATTTIQSNPVFNCECDEETDNETLGALRRRMLVRLGYSAQADDPPPGMADLLDDFLVSTQRMLYRKYKALRTTRFFTWTMVPGQRFYDLPDNDETCTKRVDPNEVEWVGFEDSDGVWLELYAGIPPEFYTSVRFTGYPVRYEIRQCIEIFPAPAAAYKLRIKGRFGLSALVEDDDTTTIDSELVFTYALATAKLHYQQPDGQSLMAQVQGYLRDLNAGTHTTRRYVPGTSPAMPWTRPTFLPIGNS
jgi:hypothetical protein